MDLSLSSYGDNIIRYFGCIAQAMSETIADAPATIPDKVQHTVDNDKTYDNNQMHKTYSNEKKRFRHRRKCSPTTYDEYQPPIIHNVHQIQHTHDLNISLNINIGIGAKSENGSSGSGLGDVPNYYDDDYTKRVWQRYYRSTGV